MNPINYPTLIPRISHSGDTFTDGGMRYRQASAALSCIYLQPNPEAMRQWLIFDVDNAGAWHLPEERGLPVPTYTAINRANGHAHIAYLLEAPVSLTEKSRQSPIRFLLDVERAFTRRLGADTGYGGHTTRNPLHPNHLTDWQSCRPWRLDELNDVLDKGDKVFLENSPSTTGTGRNVAIFDVVRTHAYRAVIKFKKTGRQECEFRDYLMEICHDVNRNYGNQGLGISELWNIARSVARWTWRKFTLEKFSATQSVRGSKPWSRQGTLTSLQPWVAQGISRATFYRRNGSIS